MRFSGFALAAALAGSSLFAGTARAQPAQIEAGAPSAVSVEVVVITANNSGKPSDPKLAKLAKRLENGLFNSFQLVGEKTVAMKADSKESIPLTNKRRLDLKPTKFTKSGQLSLLVQLFGKTGAKLVDAEAVLPERQDFMVAGPKDEDGTLMVYVRHAGSVR